MCSTARNEFSSSPFGAVQYCFSQVLPHLGTDSGRYLSDRPTTRRITTPLALAILLGLQGCNVSGTENGAKAPRDDAERTLKRGNGGDPGSLDPTQASDTYSFEVLRDLYEGLTTSNPDGSIGAGVAESWLISEGGELAVFKLRSNARWSDGTQVTAQDFVDSWRRVVDPKSHSAVSDLLKPLKLAEEIISGELLPEKLGVRAVSKDTLELQLSRPTSNLLETLTHSAWFPFKTSKPTWSITNGAFKLNSWKPGNQIELLKNPFYWASSGVHFERVIYYPIADENSEFNAYRAGQIDITSSVPIAHLAEVRDTIGNELHVAPFLGVYYLGLNTAHGQLRSVSLRKCLALSIDREDLSSLLPFGQKYAYGFVPPGTRNYDPQSWDWHDLGREERHALAMKVCRGAGISKSKPLRLRLLFNANSAIRRMMVAVAGMWKEKLGVEVELIDEEYRVFLQSRKDKQSWDVIRLGWVADVNDATDFLSTFRTGSENNDSSYHNPRFDELLIYAVSTSEIEKRKNFLESAERIMLQNYPVIPLYFYVSKRLVKPYIAGFVSNPLNRLYSKHLSFKITHDLRR